MAVAAANRAIDAVCAALIFFVALPISPLAPGNILVALYVIFALVRRYTIVLCFKGTKELADSFKWCFEEHSYVGA